MINMYVSPIKEEDYTVQGIGILFISLLILTCSSCFRENTFPTKWEEAGYNAETEIKHGVPAFDAAKIEYKRNGKTILNLRFEPPVTVDVATKPEKWGFFQFPDIYWSGNDVLVATWQMAADAVESYGNENPGISVSKDKGKTWTHPSGNFSQGGGLLLPDGDRIRIYTPKAIKASDLQLSSSLDSVVENYGRTFVFYKMDGLPEELRGVYLKRLNHGTNNWIIEHAALNDQDAVRYSDSGLFPVVWWGDMCLDSDGSVVAGIYPGFCLNKKGKVDPSGIIFYCSADNGHSWHVRGRIPYTPDLKTDPNGNRREALGFTEPASVILHNGTYLCVMRTTDGLGNSPMYISFSQDKGRTWSQPSTFTRSGVLPRLIQLENGVIVLSSGRPGVQLRFSSDGKGELWTDPFELLPFEGEKEAVSCGYTEIIPSGPDKFIIIFSDFRHKTENGEIRKAIKIRQVTVMPTASPF